MKKLALQASVLLCSGFLFGQGAIAQSDLAQSKNCTNCHAVDKKIIGPSFNEVAIKYRGDKEAKDRLVAKVMQGGAGVWGPYAMPANPQVTAEEAKTLVAWVLGLK